MLLHTAAVNSLQAYTQMSHIDGIAGCHLQHGIASHGKAQHSSVHPRTA